MKRELESVERGDFNPSITGGERRIRIAAKPQFAARTGELKVEQETKSLIVTPTKCKLCGHLFRDSILHSAAIVGSTPQAQLDQVQAIVKPLMDHLQKKHSNHIVQAQFMGGQFAGWLTVDSAFEMDDDTKKKLGHDFTRWKIRQIMTPPDLRVSDERLEERLRGQLTQMIGNEDDGEMVKLILPLLIELRNHIEERGKYVEQPQSNVNGKPS